MKKYIFLDFKRWFYNALKFIAVYILMLMLQYSVNSNVIV